MNYKITNFKFDTNNQNLILDISFVYYPVYTASFIIWPKKIKYICS